MTSTTLPSIEIAGQASTEDCKRLLGAVPAAMFPDGNAEGSWKRTSKSGSAPRVERLFLHSGGAAALVVEGSGRLAVEAFAGSMVELWAATGTGPMAKKPAKAAKAALEAQPDKALARKAKAAMGQAEEDDGEAWIELLEQAARTPLGSPERVAIGAQFVFMLPTPDYDVDEGPIFEICAKGGWPEPDMPHHLESLSEGYGELFESPNESCTHFVHVGDGSPEAAIAFLLDNGFAFDAKQDLSLAVPEYAAALRARLEGLELDASTPQGKPKQGKAPGL